MKYLEQNKMKETKFFFYIRFGKWNRSNENKSLKQLQFFGRSACREKKKNSWRENFFVIVGTKSITKTECFGPLHFFSSTLHKLQNGLLNKHMSEKLKESSRKKYVVASLSIRAWMPSRMQLKYIRTFCRVILSNSTHKTNVAKNYVFFFLSRSIPHIRQSVHFVNEMKNMQKIATELICVVDKINLFTIKVQSEFLKYAQNHAYIRTEVRKYNSTTDPTTKRERERKRATEKIQTKLK